MPENRKPEDENGSGHTSSRNNAPGRILSICVSRKKLVQYHGRTVSTGIFKKPIEGKVALRSLNLEGDEQVQGFIDTAVNGEKESVETQRPSALNPG